MDAFNPRSENITDDRLRDACGVFGIIGSAAAAEQTTLGLHALQHRGQDACGIVSYDGKRFHASRALGLVGESLTERNVLSSLQGYLALGHNRYTTSDSSVSSSSIQPMFAELDIGGVALSHNGNFTNALTLRRKLVSEGSIFQSYSDSEVLIHLLARARGSITERLLSVLGELHGGFAIGMLTHDKLIGFRDKHGIRPLLLGRTRDGAWIIASESCAFDIIDARLEREIAPGEMVIISSDRSRFSSDEPIPTDKKNGVEARWHCSSLRFAPRVPPRACVFERIYFSRPDSLVKDGKSEARLTSTYQVRKRIGAELAREFLSRSRVSSNEFDVVVPIPDSGVAAALGFASQLNLPMDFGIIRNHYVGRTFIEPEQEIRHFGVRLKHNADASLLRGKRVILIDDSLVRGTTSRKIIELVRQAGAVEVHMCIASPPITHPCYYGVATPEREELLASNMSVDEIGSKIGCDSLQYLSASGLFCALRSDGVGTEVGCVNNKSSNSCMSGDGWCSACFTGDYPVELIDKELGKEPHRQLNLLTQVNSG